MSSQQDPASSDQLSARKRPLTSAEKQRNYRERLKQAPERYELFKQREAERQRERTRTRKQTEEQVASQRMKWRERVRKHRLRKKQEASMNETQFQDTFYTSEGSTNSSVMPQVFGGSEELPTAMSFNQSSYSDVEYSQANANSCPDMNIGQYVMDAHKDRNRDESGNNVVKLECNTPEREDNSTHEINVEARNHFFAQQYVHVASENGFRVTHSQVNHDGNLANVEQIPFQKQTGRTVLSLVEGFCGEPPKKRKPLTPAERQRNYRARLKAQPGKWEQYRSRDTNRRRRTREPSTEIVSEPKEREYQRRKRVKGGSSTRSKMKETGQVNGCLLPGAPSYAEDFSAVRSTEETITVIDCIQSNADSHLDMSLSEVKLEQGDLDTHGTSNRDNCEDNMLNFTPDVRNNYTNSTVEVRDSFNAGKLVEVTNENGFDVGQSPVHVGGSRTNVEDMQDHMLTSSCKPQQKKWLLIPAERQQNYRARRKAQQEMMQQQQQLEGPSVLSQVVGSPGRLPQKKWPLTPTERQRRYRSRRKAKLEMMQKQKKMSEEAASLRRRKATERKREYRRRKKDSGDFPSTSSTEALTLTSNDVVNVKLECIAPDTGDNCTNSNFEVRVHSHAERYGEVTSEIENEVGQTAVSAVYGDVSLTNIEEMQTPLLEGSSVLSLVGGSSGRLPQKKLPLTPAERQRNYRARRKAKQEMMQKLSEEAASLRRRKATERKREYRQRKKDSGDFPSTSSTEVVTLMNQLNQSNCRSFHYDEANADSQLDMNLSQLKLQQCDLDKDANNGAKCTNNMVNVKLESITPDTGDNRTNVSLEVRDYSRAERFEEMTSEIEGGGVSHGAVFGDGNPANVEDMQTPLLEGPSVLSLFGGSPGRLPQKKLPLTPAERQRNYRARRKAQQEIMQKLSEEADSLRRRKATERKREYRRRKKDSGDFPSTSSAEAVTLMNQLNQSNCSSFHYGEANTDSQLDMNLSQLKLQQCDLDKDANNGAKCTNNMVNVKLESITPDTGDNGTNVSLEVRDYSRAERLGEMTSEIECGVSHSAVFGDGNPANVEEMQTHQLEGPSVLSLVGDSSGRLPQKKWPLTPAERQQNYMARHKAQQEMMQKLSEEAASLRRRKATERKREYRRRQKDSEHFPSTSSTEALTLTNNDVVNVKPECTAPDTVDNCTNAILEARDYSHEIENGFDQNAVTAVYGDGSLTNVEEMQTRLPAGSSVSSPVAGSPGRSSEKRSPLTPAERQQQYRARLKAQPDKWEQYKSRDAERRKRVLEMKKISESAAALRRKKARERQRAYRHRKREKEELSMKNTRKDTGPANMRPSSNCVDISSTRTTDKIIATKLNQNRYRSTDYMQTNTDSHFYMNSAEMKKDQYVMDAHGPTNNLDEIECNTPDVDGNSTHEVNLHARNCFPEQQSMQVTSENEGGNWGQLLTSPSGSSLVEGVQRRSKRRRPMTPAERQRKYRAGLKAQAEKREQHRSRDTERPRNIQEQTKVSEDVASQLRKMAKERKNRLGKRDVEELDAHGKHRDAGKANMCLIPVDSWSTRTTRRSTAARRQPNRSVKDQQTIGVFMKTEQRDDGRCSSTERHKQQTEDEIAYKRMKGRERMRRFRLKQKQILENAYQGVSESDMSKITAVWSVSERDQLRAQMEQEQFCGQSPGENTQYLPSYFGNSAPVCNLSNMPKTNIRMTHNLATTVPHDDMGSPYGFDLSPLIVYSRGNANTLEHSGIPTAIASQTSQPNHNEEEQDRGTFQENEIPFRTRKNTSAERQRKYRERLQQNPEKWAAYKQKATERYLVRKEVMTMKQVVKHRKQSLLRTRLWRARVKESKNSKDIALNDSFQDGISEEETPTFHLQFPAEKNKHSSISEKFAGFKGVKSMGQSGKRRHNKSPEEMERLRQANRERQRRHRAKKRGELEESMPSTSSFAVNTNHPELANWRLINGMEMSQSSECSTQFRICPNLPSSEHMSPRKRGRPQLPTKFIEQPTPQVRKKRGRAPKHSPLITEQPTDAVTTDTIVSPLGNECHGGVLVSSAGNIPMVIRTPEVKGERDSRWEEIPQVIPCDPPEVDYDWGNVELDHFQPDLDGVAPMGKVEVTESVPGEVEGGCVSGSARRKAFFPTRHNTADLTLNAAWAVETPLGDP